MYCSCIQMMFTMYDKETFKAVKPRNFEILQNEFLF